MRQTDANEQELKQALEQIRGLKSSCPLPPGFCYYGIEDFVLQHGTWYRSDKTPTYFGAQKKCFGNAIVMAGVHGLRYIEGFAWPDIEARFPIHHGWNLTQDGELVDSTWMNTGLAYIGVEFSLGRADNANWYDSATVLDNPFNRKIYRQPWTGEDFNLVWRKSKARRRMESLALER